MSKSAFWAVWCPTAGSPTVRHETESHAIAEAERLARLHQGSEFYVLEATHLRVMDSMQRVCLRDDGESDIPF